MNYSIRGSVIMGAGITIVQPELQCMILGCCTAHFLFWNSWQGSKLAKASSLISSFDLLNTCCEPGFMF